LGGLPPCALRLELLLHAIEGLLALVAELVGALGRLVVSRVLVVVVPRRRVLRGRRRGCRRGGAAVQRLESGDGRRGGRGASGGVGAGVPGAGSAAGAVSPAGASGAAMVAAAFAGPASASVVAAICMVRRVRSRACSSVDIRGSPWVSPCARSPSPCGRGGL